MTSNRGPNRAIADALDEALRLHQAGHLKAADERYEAILAQHPDSADAAHYLGVCRLQQGDAQAAYALLHAAAERLPGHPQVQNNLGEALRGSVDGRRPNGRIGGQ
ncbi:MAG: tetratricopeptide repeat protein [Pseudomonadota bacterium]